jgi:hypothetical protein
MAKRLAIYTIPSDSVQGEGSYVKVRAVTRGESKELARVVGTLSTEESIAREDKFLAEHIYEWNWVDDDGAPLPLPSESQDVLDRLTIQESSFLAEAITGEKTQKK